MTDYKGLCTILVNSCDSYEEAWMPFFRLFREYWPNCPFNIVLATQSKTSLEPGITTIHTGDGAWSQRINRALKQIETPYVLLFLEDYFLLKRVKQKEFLYYLNEIAQNQDIGAFYFNRIEGYDVPSDKYVDFYDMNKTPLIKYHLNCQIALWNREIFEEATRPIMSPWEFEYEGFGRVSERVRTKFFFCSQKTKHTMVQDFDVFSYLVHPKNGIGISKSKWLWNNETLFKKHNINCNFVTLDRMSHTQYRMQLLRVKVVSMLYGIYHFFIR